MYANVWKMYADWTIWLYLELPSPFLKTLIFGSLRIDGKFRLINWFTKQEWWKSVKISAFLSDCNGTRTHTHLVRKRTLNHLAKLAFSFIILNGTSEFIEISTFIFKTYFKISSFINIPKRKLKILFAYFSYGEYGWVVSVFYHRL